MIDYKDIKAFDTDRQNILKEREQHQQSKECKGTDCPICKQYKTQYDLAQPLN